MTMHKQAVAAMVVLAREMDRPVTMRLVAAIVICVLGGAIAALSPLALRAVIDAVGGPASPACLMTGALCTGHWVVLLAAYVGAMALVRLAAEVRAVLTSAADQHVLARLRQRYFEQLLSLPLSFHLERRTGAQLQDLQQACIGYQLISYHCVNSVVPVIVETSLVMGVLTMLGQPFLTLTVLATAAAYLLVMRLGSARLHTAAAGVTGASAEMHARLAEGLTNYEPIKCFAAEHQILARFGSTNTELERHWSSLQRAGLRRGSAAIAVFATSMSVALALAGLAVVNGSLTVGGFVLVNLYMLQLARPFETLCGAVRDVSQALAFIGPVLDVLAMPAAEGYPADHARHAHDIDDDLHDVGDDSRDDSRDQGRDQGRDDGLDDGLDDDRHALHTAHTRPITPPGIQPGTQPAIQAAARAVDDGGLSALPRHLTAGATSMDCACVAMSPFTLATRGAPSVAFLGIDLSLGDRPNILHDLNLELPAGCTTALVGQSGSGKSTLIRLLLRLYEPARGRIFLDGVSIDALPVRSVRQMVALVPQDIILMNSSLGDNIALGRSESTPEEIERAACLAGLHAFVRALPAGYDTPLGERGLKVSGGERQRIAIARAILRDPSILVLDEATSMLDSTSEAQVLANLRRLSKGRTTLMVAHRLSTIQRADQIAVLEAGRVVEQGDHSSLLARGGRYAALWQAQQGGGPRRRPHPRQPRNDEPTSHSAP